MSNRQDHIFTPKDDDYDHVDGTLDDGIYHIGESSESDERVNVKCDKSFNL